MTGRGAFVAATVAAAAVAIPASAAGPHKGGTYGGGTLDADVSNIVSAKVAKNGNTVDLLARIRMRCGGDTRREQIVEFGGIKIDGKGSFSGRSGGAEVKGTFAGGKVSGTLANSAGGCRQAQKSWAARDVDAPSQSRGGAKRNKVYYGTNDTVQDLFDASGARGPFMLRVAKNGKSVTHAFMRALWACQQGTAAPERFFDNQDLTKRFKINKRGRFGRSFEAMSVADNGEVTVFRTSFKGRFKGGRVKGTWREETETRPNADSSTVLSSCDSGAVSFVGLP